ncbi:MAG TPA: DUF4142 domain-containing protein [Isosphaeraceae bacterium]|jgi:putative membrane protein|nr:DUF4142 domain-containing protein [Isosphaeraceae bacterium]
MTRSLTFAALAAMLVAAVTYAQAPSRNPNSNQNQAAPPGAGRANAAQTGNQGAVNDALFAAAAAIDGMAEVQLAELGERKATDPELKRFSRQMLDEHTRMNRELTDLAARKRVALPQNVDQRAAFCAQSLAGLSGEEFDRCYAKAQFVAHMGTLAAFEAEARRGQDADIKALASRAVPHIKDHLRQIKPIAQRYMKDDDGDRKADRDEK